MTLDDDCVRVMYVLEMARIRKRHRISQSLIQRSSVLTRSRTRAALNELRSRGDLTWDPGMPGTVRMLKEVT